MLSGNAIGRIAASPVESMTITDSIAPTQAVLDAPNLRVFTIAPILADAMQRISDETSVSQATIDSDKYYVCSEPIGSCLPGGQLRRSYAFPARNTPV